MSLDRRFALLLWLGKVRGRAFDPRLSVAARRRGFAQTNRRFGLRGRRDVDVRELRIPASDGASIAARLYRRGDVAGGMLPVLLYFHGGGWVIGDLAGYDGCMRYIAHHGRFAVLAVGYRLGPEYRFPRGHEDAFDAYAWLAAHAAELGVDAERIAVGGDSAGGGLAAALANYAESRGAPRPAFAWLIYPAVDATGRFPSRRAYTGNLPLTPAVIAWFTEHATNGTADRFNPLVVPLDAPHPERHPPVYLSAARHDPLVDEGRAYYERLRAAGVAITYDLRPTLPHAFVNVARVIPAAKRAVDAGIRATAFALRDRTSQPPYRTLTREVDHPCNAERSSRRVPRQP